jgi:hypothetical protein
MLFVVLQLVLDVAEKPRHELSCGFFAEHDAELLRSLAETRLAHRLFASFGEITLEHRDPVREDDTVPMLLERRERRFVGLGHGDVAVDEYPEGSHHVCVATSMSLGVRVARGCVPALLVDLG